MASLSHAQEGTDFTPASTNVWGAEYPRVDGAGRVEVRLKAPEATKVRLNFWSGPYNGVFADPDVAPEPARLRATALQVEIRRE